MELDRLLQVTALAAALVRGVGLGVLWELTVALRIVLGAYRPPERMRRQYEKPLPLLSKGVPFGPCSKVGKLRVGLVTGICDLLFCTTFAVTAILTLFGYRDGRLQLSVPLLMLLGFGAMHKASALLLARPMQYLASLG